MNTLGNNNKHRHLATLAYSTGRVCLVLALALAFTLSMMGGVVQAAPSAATAPGLGSASSFAVLAGTAVTCTDYTVTGDVGVYPGTAVTQTNSTIAGTVHAGDAVAQAAHNDFLSAYNAFAQVKCDVVLTGTLAGLTLAPGVYCFDAAVAETGGVLTLKGPSNGIWIFKVGTLGTGALTGTNFSVVMAGGGQAGNVTWLVAEAATLTDSNFLGTILAGSAITITRGTFDGRALAKAAVTLTGAAVTAPTPVSPTPTPVTPTPTPTNTPEPTPTTGQTPVDLRSAGSFVILSKSGITNVPTSAITGDVGTSPITGAAITGLDCAEVTGTIYTVNAAGPACRVENPVLLTAAVSDMETAYTDAAGRTLPDFTELGAGNIDGMTLAPGLYKWGTVVTIPTGVTLSGGANDVWIFQIAQGLTVGNGAIVTLSGGAQAKNIFWAVAGAVTLGTTSEFNGNILAKTNIAMNTGATLNGRALAQTAVTLIANIITVPTAP